MLLRRYGVVFRELVAARIDPAGLARLSSSPSAGFEDRGEVRGGRFVGGLVGEQFALPEAVESLRAMRQATPSGQIIAVSAADPLNLAGVIVPGDRVAAISGRFVRFRDGVALDTTDDGGASLHDLKDAKAGA
jgi:ATP-dependent Lhr-like helicase